MAAPRPRKGYRYIQPEALAKIARMNLVARSVVEGFIAGLHRSPFRGFSVEFAEHREYMPGDNIKDIDWQVYGRTDRFYVKQYEEETNLRSHILLDTSSSMCYKSDENGLTKLEYACYLAACLAYLMIRQQDSVGLVCFDDRIRQHIPARATPTHLSVMLRQLEQLQLTTGVPTNVSNTFHDVAEYIRRRGLLIILSDLYDDPHEVIRGLRHFRFKKHEVILFHIFDKWELDFPFRKLSDFVDMETNEEIQVDPRYVREEYRKQVQQFIDDYRRDCSASRVEYVHTDTSVPYDFMLSSYLAKRKRLA
ncbi:MAG: DUF58 domain-containing protein [Candidatus Brocadiia bacterium]